MITLRLASLSEPGARSHNEDHLAWGRSRNGHWAVLSDGAGGHQRGAEASRRAVDCLRRLLDDDSVGYSPANLTRMVELAHAELQAHQGPDTGGRADAQMHATLVALWITADLGHALWTHVGDSRLYRVRHGAVDVVTVDDSVVQSLLRAGLISAEQLETHPQKHHLLAALGMSGEVEPHTVARPVELVEGDAFLLCSDGLWEGITPAQIARTLASALSPQQWLDQLAALVRAHARPRQDNYSAIALWAGDPGEVTHPRAEDTRPRLAP